MQNPRKEVNAVLKREAAYFGDIVILPFMDRYELVVLKTVAICEYGVSLAFILFSCFLLNYLINIFIVMRLAGYIEFVFYFLSKKIKIKVFYFVSLYYSDIFMQIQNVTAEYIMKCDDDTFIRVDTILKELDGVSTEKSLYMGNLNLLHRPLRTGKWAVTYEVYKFPSR